MSETGFVVSGDHGNFEFADGTKEGPVFSQEVAHLMNSLFIRQQRVSAEKGASLFIQIDGSGLPKSLCDESLNTHLKTTGVLIVIIVKARAPSANFRSSGKAKNAHNN